MQSTCICICTFGTLQIYILQHCQFVDVPIIFVLTILETPIPETQKKKKKFQHVLKFKFYQNHGTC